MKSKLIRYTLPLMTFLAAACSKTLDQPPVETKEAPVTIRTQANGGNDTNQLNASETAVKSVRIYIFDGGKLDRMQYFDTPDGGIQLKMRAKVGSGKTFCAVVNELPEVKDELDNVGTPGQLNAVMYSLAGYLAPDRNIGMGDASQTESYFLPFYGQTDNVTITEDGAALSLEIERAVARMDVYLRAEEKAVLDCHVTPASTLKVERSSAKGYFAPATPNQTPGADRTFTSGTTTRLDKATSTDKSGYKIIFSFYLPAQQFAQPENRLRLTLADLTWGEDTKWTYKPFLFGDHIPAFDNTIRPNKVYKLYCTLSQAAFPVDISVVVEDWDVKVQHGGL